MEHKIATNTKASKGKDNIIKIQGGPVCWQNFKLAIVGKAQLIFFQLTLKLIRRAYCSLVQLQNL